MSKVAIIPAAGKAQRFGGIPKELLPLPNGRSLLEHAIERVSFCDEIVVITNPEKCALHMRLIGDNARLVFQNGNGLWGAMQTGMNAIDGDQYYMTMPDTYIDSKCFAGVPRVNFGYGYFLTNEPRRFGVLKNDFFVDKPQNMNIPAIAWGVLTWNGAIKRFWNDLKPSDYTEAINMALDSFVHGHWNIGPYFDCANIESYLELLDYLRKQNA